MSHVMAYLILRYGWDRSSEIEAWRASLEEAERYLNEHPPTTHDQSVEIGRLTDAGGFEHVSWHEHEPERYYGPLVRARVQFMKLPGHDHRVPIDCARPQPDFELTVEAPWRVVATSCCGGETWHQTDEFCFCHCGDWQEIEGNPDAVAEMVERYGVT